MATIDITGAWRGEIIYGRKYRQYEGRTLFFEAEFTQNGNSIQGNSVDTGGVGANPDPAEITGSIRKNKISFVKQYSTLAYMDEEGNNVIDRSQAGPEIYYFGIYDEQTGMFSGIWEYRIKVKFLWIIPSLYRAGGVWSMTRR
jgi:hypothetical protein